MKAWKKLTSLITGTQDPHYVPKNLTKRQLIEIESEQGKMIFGPVTRGHRREFFRLDDHTWVWYEEWNDENGKKRSRTTRYELHTNGVLKIQDNGAYSFIEGEELHNLAHAVQTYYERVMRNVYHRDPASGHLLTAQPATI